MSVLYNRTVRRTSDLDRIVNLPRRSTSAVEFGETIANELTELLALPNKCGGHLLPGGICSVCKGPTKLRPVQAAALHDVGTLGGLFGPIPVGHGKTAISLLAPYVLDAQRPLLVLPASLLKKTKKERAEKYDKHWRIPNNIQSISYEALGRVNYSTFLEEMNPDLIVFDEVHRAKNKRAAVTRRLIRYMRARPNTMVVALSGTVMRKSLLDFGHILRWCLKKNAPIPETDVELEEWAQALDERIEEYERAELGALKVFSGGVDDLDEVRRGFKERLVNTPGVVAVTGGEDDLVTCSLSIRALKYNVAPVTEQHFAKLRKDMLTPDNLQLMQAVDVWRHARELALGFHYVQVGAEAYSKWLTDVLKQLRSVDAGITQNTAKNGTHIAVHTTDAIRTNSKSSGANTLHGIAPSTRSGSENTSSNPGTGSDSQSGTLSSKSAAEHVPSVDVKRKDSASITTTSLDAFGAFSAVPVTEVSAISATMLKAYRAQFAIFAESARPPEEWRRVRREWNAFVREILAKSRTLDSPLQVVNACDAGRLPNQTLEAWRAIEHTFKPVTVPVWHDDSALRVCLEWMREPGIVWVEHQFFGHCLAALSGKKYYGAKGLTDRGEFIDDADPNTAVILSIDANKEGRNLQHKWSRNLVTAPPEGADIWQQMLGRTHRPGQIADEVEVDVLLGCKEHANAWRRALSAAEAIRDTTGADSKLLLADVDWPSEDEIAGFAGARWR